MEDNTEKTLVLQALNSKNYKVEYKPTNSIDEFVTKKGQHFYAQVDVHRMGLPYDDGNFTFIVQTGIQHTFIYDMTEGTWTGDELCSDNEVIKVIRSLDEFIDSEDYGSYEQWQIYCLVNGIDENVGYYWYEDEDCPANLE